MADIIRGHEKMRPPAALFEQGRDHVRGAYTSIVKSQKQRRSRRFVACGNGLRGLANRCDGFQVLLKKRKRQLVESGRTTRESAYVSVVPLHDVVIHQ